MTIDVAAFLKDDAVPAEQKTEVRAFAKQLDLDPTTSDAEKYRLLQAKVLILTTIGLCE